MEICDKMQQTNYHLDSKERSQNPPSMEARLPPDYNPEDYPPVKLRNHNNSNDSETQRKRRSKNRLSNRRSTGYYTPPDVLEEAKKMGPNGDYSVGPS